MRWHEVAIKDVCLLAVDCVNKTAPTVDYETPYKMLRTPNVRGGFVRTDEVKYVTKEVFDRWTRRSLPQRGDVILTREAPLGDVGRVTCDDNIFLGQRLFHYRADPEKLDPNYLTYVLQSPLVQGRIKSKGFGATVDHAKVGDCENLKIPLPPLEYQKKIGEILVNYDDLIENNRRRIALLEEAAQQLYKEWFIRLQFPSHEDTGIVDGIPNGWEQKPIGSITAEITDRILPGSVAQDYPYLGLEHLPRRSIALMDWGVAADVESSKFKFEKGDILFGKIRPYFHKVIPAPFEGICSSDTIVIRSNQKELWAFVLAVTTSERFVAYASQTSRVGARMPRADWKKMKDFVVLIPPEPILKRFSDLVEKNVNLIQTLCTQNSKLTEARDLLLPRLMSGAIEV